MLGISTIAIPPADDRLIKMARVDPEIMKCSNYLSQNINLSGIFNRGTFFFSIYLVIQSFKKLQS